MCRCSQEGLWQQDCGSRTKPLKRALRGEQDYCWAAVSTHKQGASRWVLHLNSCYDATCCGNNHSAKKHNISHRGHQHKLDKMKSWNTEETKVQLQVTLSTLSLKMIWLVPYISTIYSTNVQILLSQSCQDSGKWYFKTVQVIIFLNVEMTYIYIQLMICAAIVLECSHLNSKTWRKSSILSC